jgi:hypothetical protein
VIGTAYPATPKQIGFIRSLVVQCPNAPERVLEAIADPYLTTRDASRVIDELLVARKSAPRAAAAPAAPVAPLEPGMYRAADGGIYKVQRSKTSGGLYAKQLVEIAGARLTEAEQVVNFEFQYAPGAVHTLTADDRMSLEQAKAFGIQYGVCCVCGATLKDAHSVAMGIGPVCAKNV